MTVIIRAITAADAPGFIASVQRSRALHGPWVSPAADLAAFAGHLARMQAPGNQGFLVCQRADGQLAGCVNLTHIVRGNFCSGYLAYFAFEGFQGRGLMKQGLSLVARHAFQHLGLHRLEANIQPGNAASIALAKACGFQHEGYSPRYLKIGGRWRDHERWALLKN